MPCTVSINIPFITGRCDFYGRNLRPNTAPTAKHVYLDALVREARSIGDDLTEPVDCIAFENGAIGTVEPAKLREFLPELASALPLADDCFVSAEVDCGLMSTATVEELRSFGIDVLRFHYLTSDPIESEWLQRACAVGEMAKSRIVMESAGLSNLDMEILVGLRGQTEKSLLKTLREAVLCRDVHHCTVLAAAGDLAADAPVACQQFEVARDFLLEHGFSHYAPLCFAQPDHELAVEQRRKQGSFVSLGPSTVSRLDGIMWANSGDFDAYVESGADAETITESVVEVEGCVQTAQEKIAKLWAMGSIDAASVPENLEAYMEGGRLSALGCLNFDDVARAIVTAECMPVA